MDEKEVTSGAEETAPAVAEAQLAEHAGADDEQRLSAPLTETVDAAELLVDAPLEVSGADELRALIEAVIYVTEEPLSIDQIAAAIEEPKEKIAEVLASLTDDYARADRGITIREVAGGYKMGTKPEHHEKIRLFVKKLKPPLKLSLAALETLAVIAYKQPVTAPEIGEIRGVQGTGVLKTLIDRKLIAPAGRKNVIGKPILYKTTREFLLQFGLRDLSELPTLKEFEELRRLALTDEPDPLPRTEAPPPPPTTVPPATEAVVEDESNG